jgi:hypothetical protein
MAVNKERLFATDGFVGLSAGIRGGCRRGMSTFVVVVAGITKQHEHITCFISMPGKSVTLFV